MIRPRPAAIVTVLLALPVAMNFWVFGRFTVDDAFITWRYGRNLVQHGIWAFNPSMFDLTQAYTNPVFALLAILPAATGFDVVLAFKLLSLLTVGTLAALLLQGSRDRWRMALILMLLLAVPASVVHAVSGLETVLYGGALALLFIEAQQGRWNRALGLALLLVLTRPEAWLLFALYPAMLVSARLVPDADAPPPGWTQVAIQTVVLWSLALVYFGVHLWWFGQALPNTYFIKSGPGITVQQAVQIMPFALPALAVLVFGNRRIGAAMTLYFGAVAWNYSGSDLLMNYLQRFPFQIVFPLALYLGWALSRHAPQQPAGIRGRNWALVGLVVYIGAFAAQTRSLGDHLGIANYYPRLLDSHVALGRSLSELGAQGRVSAVAMGDAGAGPFHAGLPTLDTIGLGSKLVARQGVTLPVVRAYAPDVLTFFATVDGLRDLPARHAALHDYADQTGMTELCEVVWARHYTLRLFTRTPLPELLAVCERSRAANDLDEVAYALRNLRLPPWHFWRE